MLRKVDSSLQNFTRIISQSCVIVWWLLLSYNFSVSTNFHFDFLSSLSSWFSAKLSQYVWSSVSFQIVKRKVVFLRLFFQPFWLFCCLFWRDKRGAPKTDSPRRGLCTGHIYDFNYRELLVYFNSNTGCLHSPPCFFLFAVLLVIAEANRKRWIQICCKTSWSFSGNTSSKTKICCRK